MIENSRKCAVCSHVLSGGEIVCPECGSGVFETEKRAGVSEAGGTCGICGLLSREGRYVEYTYGFYRQKTTRATDWGLIPGTVSTTKYWEFPLGRGGIFLCADCIRKKLRRSIIAPLATALLCGLTWALFVFNFSARSWLGRLVVWAGELPFWIVVAGGIALPLMSVIALWTALRNYAGNKYALEEKDRIDFLAADHVRDGLRETHEHLKPDDDNTGEYDPAGLNTWRFEVRPVRIEEQKIHL